MGDRRRGTHERGQLHVRRRPGLSDTDQARIERQRTCEKAREPRALLVGELLLGTLAPDEGEVRVGSNVQIAYYDQQREQLDPEQSVADSVNDGNDTVVINGQPRPRAGQSIAQTSIGFCSAALPQSVGKAVVRCTPR